jgi:poly-gamma-glutamate synthesis protein (capsule biosynthesis protein)
VHVFSLGDTSSGIPWEWGAGKGAPGVNLLPDLSPRTAEGVRESVRQVKQVGDLVVASIHWGGNWGFEIPPDHVDFAHRLIESAGVDIVHGHSSHHVKGMEVYRGKLIIYGCGDFLTDYEGISGNEAYRGGLGFMYFASVEASTGLLKSLRLVPTRVRKFQVVRAGGADWRWLLDTMNREGKAFGNYFAEGKEQALQLRWKEEPES